MATKRADRRNRSAKTRTNSEIVLRITQSDGLVIERYRYSRGWTEPLQRHAHDTWQIGWSSDAVGEHTCRGVTSRTGLCEFSVIAPGEVHAPSQDPWVRAQCEFVMMYVDRSFMRAALQTEDRSAVLRGDFRGIAVIANPALAASFRRFLHHEAQGSRLAIDVSLHRFLAGCAHHLTRQRPGGSPPGREHRAVRTAVEVLHSRLADDVSLKQLAADAGLSAHRLCRSFSAHIGVPPHAYQLRLRIDRAKTLLVRDRRSLTEIAASLGFADQSHLGRCFKRVVGTTPGQYRRCASD